MVPIADAARRYADWRDGIFRRESDRVRELSLPDPAPSPPEIEIQARWFAGEFGREFTSPDGETIEVVQFGHWNRGAGPDFTEVAVRIEGEVQTGSIEVDLEAPSWESHGHGANPAFDEVVLHVFLGQPASAAEFPRFHTRNSRHRRIVQLALDPSRIPGGGRPWGQVPEARMGRCATPLAEMAGADLESLLVAAAQYRLHRKARRFSAIAEAHTENQALFQTSAEALGYRHNSVAMAILTQRLPLTLLRRQSPAEREALLFGVAGFLDHEHYQNAPDSEAREYLKALWDHWWKARHEHEPDAEFRRLSWKLSGSRPTNHPQRRVAALATLVDQWTTFRQLVSGESETEWTGPLQEFLGGLTHPYWSHHYTLRAKPSERPLALIGKDRIRDLLGNVLFPTVLIRRPALWDAYRKLPGSVINEKLRRACLRLFGDDQGDLTESGHEWSRLYWQQQALLQIYTDFCLVDASECEGCPFPEQLNQWRRHE